MTNRETWKEFAKRVKPKDGDTFMDRRGNYWVYRYRTFYCGEASVSVSGTGSLLDCPLIEAKKPVLWALGWVKYRGAWALTSSAYPSLDALTSTCGGAEMRKWPALPNAEGYFEEPTDE